MPRPSSIGRYQGGRTAEQREILFDLDTAIAQFSRAGAERAALDRLMKTRSNLLRMWVED